MATTDLAPDPQIDRALPLSLALNPETPYGLPSPAYQSLGCPKCRCNRVSAHGARTKKGNDNYDAQGGGWSGRGNLLAIRMSCEEGHNWDICIGFHKGDSAIFVRIGEDTNWDEETVADDAANET